jgi:hypothetical protein
VEKVEYPYLGSCAEKERAIYIGLARLSEQRPLTGLSPQATSKMDTAGQNQLQQWLATHGMQPELMAEAAPRPGRKIHSWVQGVYLTPLGLFLRTSVPCTWRLVCWATAGPLEPRGGEGLFLLAAPSLGGLERNLDPADLGLRLRLG